MKELIINKNIEGEIRDAPIPTPSKDQIVIKIEVSGSNPKDWKRPARSGKAMNHGDDIAGTVHELGPGAADYGFKVGDRVAAFHEMMTPGGSYAEYGVAWAYTTFHLPEKTTYEEGASLPLAVLTAAVAIYGRLRLPEPWTPAKESIPLVVWGGASAVGAYAIKYAQLSNIHPVIAIAGKSTQYVESIIDRSKGDTVVDYRGGDEKVQQGIKDALKGQKLFHAFDAISEKGSFQTISKVLEKGGHITLILPGSDYSEIPDTLTKTTTMVGSVHTEDGAPDHPHDPQPLKDFGWVHCQYLTKALHEGRYSGHPTELVPGGLEGVTGALRNLKDGKANAVKYVFRIKDTPGL